MLIFVVLGLVLFTRILFIGHVFLATCDFPDSTYLPSLESFFKVLAPMSAMPHIFSLKEQACIAEYSVITVRFSPECIPLENQDHINDYIGISLDFLRHLFRIIGVQFHVEPQSNWSNALEDA